MTDFYLHSVGVTGEIKDIDNSLFDLNGILDTGAILCRRSRGLSGFGFNGTKYTSLSDYDKRFDHLYKEDPRYYDYTGYEMYSTKAISIMVDKKAIDVIHPTLVPPIESSIKAFLRIIAAGYGFTNKRMSDLPDEVQVYGDIFKEAFTGITIPVSEILNNLGEKKLIMVYKSVKEMLNKYGYSLGIYNISDLNKIDSLEDIKGLIKRD